MVIVVSIPTPGIEARRDTRGGAVEIRIGGHMLAQDTGIVVPGAPGPAEDSGGVVAAPDRAGQRRGPHP